MFDFMENFKHFLCDCKLELFSPKKLILAVLFSAIMSTLTCFLKANHLTISTLLWKEFI